VKNETRISKSISACRQIKCRLKTARRFKLGNRCDNLCRQNKNKTLTVKFSKIFISGFFNQKSKIENPKSK